MKNHTAANFEERVNYKLTLPLHTDKNEVLSQRNNQRLDMTSGSNPASQMELKKYDSAIETL
jgi:hypothetical protein